MRPEAELSCASVRIRSGRSFCFSPGWADKDGIEVLFDRNSGDYWVISGGSGALLRRVIESGEVAIEASPTDSPAVDAGPPAAPRELVRELVELGILESATR